MLLRYNDKVMNKRHILPKIWENIDSPDILLLNGARQVGKTTLLKMIRRKLITEKKVSRSSIFWYDLEKVEDLAIWSKQSTVLSRLPLDSKKKFYIFVDEFQKSKNIGSILKVIHDHHPNFKCIVTGSASWYLEIDESMAGRKKVFSVWPLSFAEYLEWQPNKTHYDNYQWLIKDIKKAPLEIIEIINNHLIHFLTYGGYPRIVLSKENNKVELLSEIIDSYILRDIKVWNYAANSLQVKKILTLLADRIGCLLDVQSLATDTVLGRTALENRLELLQKTFILHLTSPYFTNKTKELVKNRKIYLVDAGLRSILMQDFKLIPKTREFGQAAENFVVSELYKSAKVIDKIHYWRTKTKQEIDVIIQREKQLIPIEIKGGDENNIPGSLKSFINHYHPRQAYVLNWSIIKDEKYKECNVLFRPLWFAKEYYKN